MRFRVFGLFSMCLIAALSPLTARAEKKVEALKEAPAGLAAEVAAAISDTGFRVSGDNGVICDVWFAKDVALKPNFKPSLRIKYPFTPGQLVGAIRFPEKSKPADFRGQEMKAGTYTLRYGLQPDDGNHLGTSEIRDFLVGCPPGEDTSAKRIEDIKALFELSAKSAGTTHPAIFLLIPPPEKKFDATSLRRDDNKDLLILQANARGKDGDKAVDVPFSLVVVGKTEGQ